MLEIIVADLSKAAHAEALVFLLNEYAQDPMGGGTTLSDFVKENLAAELQKRSGAHVIFALLENAPIGLAICFEGFSTFACQPLLNIHDVVVLAGYRGRGIAKQLLQKAEEIAVQNHCCKITLEVLEGNVGAQSVYKACGYAGYELNPAAGKALFWQKKLQKKLG